ncbi:TPA: sortase [Streptococcus agalactiae]|nr:sortase [Streptococcus agalactiae]
MIRRYSANFLAILGIILVSSGIYWGWYNINQAHQADLTSQHIVKVLDKSITHQVKGSENGELPVKKLDKTDYLGTLDIPNLKLHLPVAANYSFEQLSKTPTRYYGSYLTNNMVICAHNFPYHFDALKNVDMGTDVYFTTTTRQIYHYKISNREIIEPTAIEKVYKTATSDNDWDLSLFTCTKAGVARVLVRCQLIDVKN